MEDKIYVLSGNQYMVFTINNSGYWQQTQTIAKSQKPSGAVVSDSNPQGLASQEGNSYDDFKNKAAEPSGDTSEDVISPLVYTGGDGGDGDGGDGDGDPTSTDYGLESLKKSDFFQDDGVTQKPLNEVVDLILQHKPASEGEDAAEYRKTVEDKVKDFMPKLQAIPEEEKGFAREGFQRDVYGISKDAGKAGAQMQQAYGSGMGSQMRGAYAGMKDVAQQFKQAEQGYAQDIYGLEKQQEAGFEADVGTFLQNFKQGGRVPKKKTFLEVLSKIPDAGGS